MTELAIISLAFLNIAFIIIRDPEAYLRSTLSQFAFVAGMPVAVVTIVGLFLVGGPLVLSYITGLLAALNILHLVSLMSDGQGA